jgi:hypothetical protein
VQRDARIARPEQLVELAPGYASTSSTAARWNAIIARAQSTSPTSNRNVGRRRRSPSASSPPLPSNSISNSLRSRSSIRPLWFQSCSQHARHSSSENPRAATGAA